MSTIGNIDLTRNYQTANGNTANGLVLADTVGAGFEVKGISEILSTETKTCVFGIIFNENKYEGMASWDPISGECLWKEDIGDEVEEKISDFLKKYNLKLNGIIEKNESKRDNTLDDYLIFSEMLEDYIEDKNDEMIIESLKVIQKLSGWETLKSVNPSSKGKAIKHVAFGKLAGGRLEKNGDIELENFSYFPISGGNIIRMGGRALRYTNTK